MRVDHVDPRYLHETHAFPCWKTPPPEVVQQVFWSSMHLCAPLVLLPVQLMLPRARSVVGPVGSLGGFFLGPGFCPPQKSSEKNAT